MIGVDILLLLDVRQSLPDYCFYFYRREGGHRLERAGLLHFLFGRSLDRRQRLLRPDANHLAIAKVATRVTRNFASDTEFFHALAIHIAASAVTNTRIDIAIEICAAGCAASRGRVGDCRP